MYRHNSQFIYKLVKTGSEFRPSTVLSYFPLLFQDTSRRCSKLLPTTVPRHFPALFQVTSHYCSKTLPGAVPSYFPLLFQDTSRRYSKLLPTTVPGYFPAPDKYLKNRKDCYIKKYIYYIRINQILYIVNFLNATVTLIL